MTSRRRQLVRRVRVGRMQIRRVNLLAHRVHWGQRGVPPRQVPPRVRRARLGPIAPLGLAMLS